MLDPAMPIPAPPVSAPRLGLLASAARPDLGFDLWRNGVTFRPNQSLGNTGVQGYTWWLVDEDGEQPDEKDPGTHPGLVTWRPYGIKEADQGTAAFLTAENYRQNAVDLLVAGESRKVEAELWTGAISTVAGLGNDFLANSATLDVLGVAGPLAALAQLQQWLADTQNGRGMIHVQVRLYAWLLDANLVRRDGNLVLDGLDNIVVPGSGYPGTGPDGEAIAADTTWAYATPLVQFVEGTTDVVPGELSEALIRGTNQVIYRAERPVMAWWDNQKNHAGIEVVLCDPCGDLTS